MVNEVFDAFYHATLGSIMLFKLGCVLGFLIILHAHKEMFQGRRTWKIVFHIGSIITALGLLGDLLDGRSGLQDLHLWTYLRHVGVSVLFVGAYGLHLPLWRVALFRGSVLERLFLPKEERKK